MAFHFLSVSNVLTSNLPDIVITRNANHTKSFFQGIFEKLQILARDVFEMSQRRHGIDIFFEIFSRRIKDVI